MPHKLGTKLKKKPMEERFWSKVNKTETCWLWTGSLLDGAHKYGRIQIDYKVHFAHRVSVALSGRDIPSGMVVDHLCRNPSCVNPDHLEVVTTRENNIRGDGPELAKTRNIGMTHCKNGHEMTEENTYYYKSSRNGNTWRNCKSCFRDRYEKRKTKQEDKT